MSMSYTQLQRQFVDIHKSTFMTYSHGNNSMTYSTRKSHYIEPVKSHAQQIKCLWVLVMHHPPSSPHRAWLSSGTPDVTPVCLHGPAHPQSIGMGEASGLWLDQKHLRLSNLDEGIDILSVLFVITKNKWVHSLGFSFILSQQAISTSLLLLIPFQWREGKMRSP